jgi:hypothetical protein
VHLVNHHGFPSPPWSTLINLSRILSPSTWVLVLPAVPNLGFDYTVPDIPPDHPLVFVQKSIDSQAIFFLDLELAGASNNVLGVLLHRDTAMWCPENSLTAILGYQLQWNEFVWLVWLRSFGSIDTVFLETNDTLEHHKDTAVS